MTRRLEHLPVVSVAKGDRIYPGRLRNRCWRLLEPTNPDEAATAERVVIYEEHLAKRVEIDRPDAVTVWPPETWREP